MPARLALLLFLIALGAGTWLALDRGWFAPAESATKTAGRRPAPVETGAVERGRIVENRVFSGTLIARAQFTVAPKTGGRIEELNVDIGDEVQPNAVVARLDDDEFEQAVAEADAALTVARAQVVQAQSALDVAERTWERITELQESSIASGSEVDLADADLRARQAELEVAQAQVQRAMAVLEAARVRLGYTEVRASWSGSEQSRVVAARALDEGATVRANDPIVTVVDVSTVRAVLFVTERDFTRLQVGQPATITGDAWPGRSFAGNVERLAPVFEESSRQARVEIAIPNEDRALRPGMFVRVQIELGSADDAVIVPEAALVRRDGGDALFTVVEPGDRVRLVPVRTGILSGDRVQVFGEGLTDEVVTLGQQLLDDGSPIRRPQPLPGAEAGASTGAPQQPAR